MLNNNEPGKQDSADKEKGWRGPGKPLGVKNTYCPYDEHYCEQPHCEYCQNEKRGQ